MFSPVHPQGGYPEMLLFVVAVAARVFGSQRQALLYLKRPGIWTALMTIYGSVVGDPGPYPTKPPSPRVVDAFVTRIGADPSRMEKLDQVFTWSAVRLAEALGQFPDSDDADYLIPRAESTVFGDGTYIKPFSAVHQITDRVTGDLITVGSRSKYGHPRIQKSLTDSKLDGKNLMGVNHITLGTWSHAGAVVLGTTQALGAEVDGARRLLLRVHDVLGTRMRHVIWDRVMTGWVNEWSFSTMKTLVFNKSVARGDSRGRAKHLLITQKAAEQLQATNQPLPLGTSLYKITNGWELVRGRTYLYGPPDGIDCAHQLWVDDGAFVDVAIDARGHQVKTETATAMSALAEQAPGGLYRLRTRWHLPCSRASGGSHEFETVWNPRASNQDPITGALHKALTALRPIPRADADRFCETHGRRNTAESLNSWMKGRLGRTGRAVHIDVQVQAVDHVCLGLLVNVRTAHRAHQMAQREARLTY